MVTLMNMEEAFLLLQKSPFRQRFHLGPADREYVEKLGEERLKSHAFDFVRQKLSPAFPHNDGKQTPMKGHPLFIAMHGCAMCCRSCMEKYWHVPKGKALTPLQEERTINFLLEFIRREMTLPPPPEKRPRKKKKDKDLFDLTAP